ncbi:MAG: ATP-dependent DNA helicase [Pyrobaculum sp.]
MDYFPYDSPRPFQREIYWRVYSALERGVPALVNAPTGLGKTAAVLGAALKYAFERGLGVHYVVRTRNELEPPVRELSRLRERGVDVEYVVLKSRQDMCCYRQLRRLEYLEFLAECSLLKKMGRCEYYPPKDVEVPLKNVSTYVKMLCISKSCPYEYAKERVGRARVVVSTYYYVFGKEAADVRDKVVIVDEAHSLFNAVASLHAVKISESDLRLAYRECRRYGFLEEASKIYKLLTLIRKTSGVVEDLLGEAADLSLEEAIWEITKKKAEAGVTPYTPLLLVKELVDALRSRVKYLAEVREVDSAKYLALTPLDPVSIVKKALEQAANVVYVSGTLPIQLFSEVLNLTKYEALDIAFHQYVPRENFLSVVDVGVTTRYQERSEEMYLKIASRIAAVINASPGGVLAVFPSYEVLKAVRKYLKISIPHWFEGFDEVEIENLPNKFFIGAVAGGRFVEGVEYVVEGANLLSTVAIVGVPYPEPSAYLERRVELLKPRLKERAWGAVYLYQAVVNIRQAIGRLFRGPNDRGVLVFLDRRYVEPDLWNALRDVLAGALIVENVEEAAPHFSLFR